jgi:hypothetical protein
MKSVDRVVIQDQHSAVVVQDVARMIERQLQPMRTYVA